MIESDRLNLAIGKLQGEGHKIGAKGTAAVTTTGTVLVLVDGILRSEQEIMKMAGWPELPQ